MNIRRDPLDKLFSEMIRLERPRCEVCGRNEASQVHHWKGRRHQSVRFDPDNAWAVCFACHRKFEEDPPWAIEMQKKRLGNRYDSFVLKSNMIIKRFDHDKAMLKLWMQNEIKKLKGTQKVIREK